MRHVITCIHSSSAFAYNTACSYMSVLVYDFSVQMFKNGKTARSPGPSSTTSQGRGLGGGGISSGCLQCQKKYGAKNASFVCSCGSKTARL